MRSVLEREVLLGIRPMDVEAVGVLEDCGIAVGRAEQQKQVRVRRYGHAADLDGLGIQGDPSRLAPGVHGLGYLEGPDQRPGQVMRTKHLPEYLRPGEAGLDVRGLAEHIAADPVRRPESPGEGPEP